MSVTILLGFSSISGLVSGFVTIDSGDTLNSLKDLKQFLEMDRTRSSPGLGKPSVDFSSAIPESLTSTLEKALDSPFDWLCLKALFLRDSFFLHILPSFGVVRFSLRRLDVDLMLLSLGEDLYARWGCRLNEDIEELNVLEDFLGGSKLMEFFLRGFQGKARSSSLMLRLRLRLKDGEWSSEFFSGTKSS